MSEDTPRRRTKEILKKLGIKSPEQPEEVEVFRQKFYCIHDMLLQSFHDGAEAGKQSALCEVEEKLKSFIRDLQDEQ